VLAVIKCPGETLLQLTELVVAARYEVVNLAAAVAPHLHLEFFMQKIGQQVTILIHGIKNLWVLG
jgi:hypothetical protein